MEISINNIKLAAEVFTGNTVSFNTKDEDYQNLFLAYATDSNSSSLREAVTLHILGYESNNHKHGHDGVDIKTGKLKEVKPRSIKTGEKVGSSGNFNDMTLDLLEVKKDYDVICSLFLEDKLIYIVEFPFSIIYEMIKKPIVNAKLGKRVVCGFGYKDYDCDELVVHYFDVHTAIEKKCLSKKHFETLLYKQKKEFNDTAITRLFECEKLHSQFV